MIESGKHMVCRRLGQKYVFNQIFRAVLLIQSRRLQERQVMQEEPARRSSCLERPNVRHVENARCGYFSMSVYLFYIHEHNEDVNVKGLFHQCRTVPHCVLTVEQKG